MFGGSGGVMKFNMGCGNRKLPGYVNVDSWAGCEPDEVWDLERTPWPWPSDCAAEIVFNHSLEHMGGEPKVFLAIMSEIYRIAAPGCAIEIRVPHPRHDHFLGDPTHVRPVTPEMLRMFDKEICERVAAAGGANTPLAQYLDLDFHLENVLTILDAPYYGQLTRGELSHAAAEHLVKTKWNIAREFQMKLRVRKPQ